MREIEVNLYHPAKLSRKDWIELQLIERNAFAKTLSQRNRSQEEVNTLADALVSLDDPWSFYWSHLDPNSEVGKRYNANQTYFRPRVAVAKHAGELIGFGYSAHNVSGGGPPEGPHDESPKARLIRGGKRLSVVKNYLWVREIAVAPEFQEEGVAREIGKTLLKRAISLQPVTTYIWPEEIDFVQAKLEQLGFRPKGEEEVEIFGQGSEKTRQVRMQAPSVKSVLLKLASQVNENSME